MPHSNKENEDAKNRRFAEIYVFEHTGNQIKSYLQLCDEFNIAQSQQPNSQRGAASRFFRKPEVQKYIREFRDEAQQKYNVRKEEITLALQDIAYDTDVGIKDRLTALKQLTDIGGFATQNLNLDAKANIEVVIE